MLNTMAMDEVAPTIITLSFISILLWTSTTLLRLNVLIFFSAIWGSKCSYFVLNCYVFCNCWKSTKRTLGAFVCSAFVFPFDNTCIYCLYQGIPRISICSTRNLNLTFRWGPPTPLETSYDLSIVIFETNNSVYDLYITIPSIISLMHNQWNIHNTCTD